MGQCLSATLRIIIAANQQQNQQQQGTGTSNQHGDGGRPDHKTASYTPTTTTVSSASTLSPTYSSLPSGTESAKVRNVYDGDTLTLTDERRVRLIGIDTPELKENQPYAQEARDYTKNLCEDQTIYLSLDGDKEDHYGRLLAHVYVKQNNGYVCVNEGIVAAGFASVYSPSQDKKTRNYDKLIQLQTQAREAGRGVHGASNSGGSNDADRIVVKTKNGSAYHDKSCEHLDPSWYLVEMKISEAQDEGLHACRTCLS